MLSDWVTFVHMQGTELTELIINFCKPLDSFAKIDIVKGIAGEDKSYRQRIYRLLAAMEQCRQIIPIGERTTKTKVTIKIYTWHTQHQKTQTT